MTMPAPRPAHIVTVYEADDLHVVDGANLGDALSVMDEMEHGDIYALRAEARPGRLALAMEGDVPFRVGAGSEIGTAGAELRLDGCLTLMAASGGVVEVLVFAEIDGAGRVAAVYTMPLAPMAPRTGYALVRAERARARLRLAQAACVSLTRGTRITLATGAQMPVEALTPGARVLTRDEGAQPLRWIGETTSRAVGDFAPVRIRAGTLNNEGDLVVSPGTRLFIYQRDDALGAGRSEVLVRARDLVNGDSVRVEPGGHVDYVQLLFDAHQIIYAEGIAAETLPLGPRTRAVLPADLLPGTPGHRPAAHLHYEIDGALLEHPDAAALLRRASSG